MASRKKETGKRSKEIDRLKEEMAERVVKLVGSFRTWAHVSIPRERSPFDDE